MNQWIGIASIWISAIGFAGAFVYKMNPPRDPPSSAHPRSEQSELHARVDDESTDDVAEPTFLEMPTVTIVGNLRGAAEMQGSSIVFRDPGLEIHGP